MPSIDRLNWKDLESSKEGFALVGVSVLDAEQEIRDAVLVVKGSKIDDCGPRAQLEKTLPPALRKIDARGWLVTPGLINAHTHCALSYLRSLGHGQKQMIESLFFKTETQLTEKLVESLCYSDLLTGLRAGVTCFVDHYYFHRGTARAIDHFGLRGVVSDTLLDLQGPFHGWEPWKQFQKSLENWSFSERVLPCVGPHSSSTTSPKMFQELSAFAKAQGLPLHYHLSQTRREWAYSQQNYGKSPVAHVASLGALGENTQVVHLLYHTPEDLRILKDSGTSVGFCPSSQIIYEQLAPIEDFVKEGLKWTLGTDCAASNDLADLHAEMKVAALFGVDRGVEQEGWAKAVFAAATRDAAECFKIPAGLLRPGRAADLVFRRLGLECMPADKLYETFLFSSNAQHVFGVMVDGRVLLWNREPTRLDQPQLTAAYQDAVHEIHQNLRNS
jgi:5-methylthioadenosine/S-adenosylhomocysteine deaminase